MWKSLCAAALLAGPALAEGRTDALAAMLQRLPVAIAAEGEVIFADPAAAPALPEGADPDWSAEMRLLNRHLMPGLAVDTLDLAGWSDKAGFAVLELQQVLSFGSPPVQGVILTLAPSVLSGMPDALTAAGYAPGDGAGLFLRGEDGGFDVAGYDPGDPFGGGIGASSRVLVDPTGWMVQARFEAVVRGVATGTPRLSDRTDLMALVEALDDPSVGPGAVLNAVVLSNPLDMLPAMTLSVDMAEDMTLDQAAPSGLPGWSVALIADLSDGTVATGVLALAYPDRAWAEAAAARLAQNWAEQPSLVVDSAFAAIFAEPVRVQVMGDAPAALVLSQPGPAAPSAREARRQPFFPLYESYIRRDMVFLPLEQ
jgi:hypothetical protein